MSESLEALEDLFNLLCEREHTNSEHSFYLKLYNTIKEDLEVLEILKKYVKLIDLGNREVIDSDLMVLMGSRITKAKDYLKIRGWLKNEN